MLYSNTQWGFPFGGFFLIIILLVVWSVIWKGWALWRAARSGNKGWFIVFLLVNTAGILELIYLFVISKPAAPALPQTAEQKNNTI